MDEIKSKDRVILALEKELGAQAGHTRKLLLQKEALDEQLVQVKEAERYHGSPKKELPLGAGEINELEQHTDERDIRRFQLKIAELSAIIQKLEDRNTLLVDERNELLKQCRDTEVQLKPLVEKNKRLTKKIENMLQNIQRMEEKIKNLSRENMEMKEKLSVQPSLRRHTSLNDISSRREEKEIEFLKLQIIQQQHLIDNLTVEQEQLLHSKKQRRKSVKSPKSHVVETFFGFEEESADSEASSVTSFTTDKTDRTPDAPKDLECIHEQLEGDLFKCQAKIEDLKKALTGKGQDSKVIEEKQVLLRTNQKLLEKIYKMELEKNWLKNEMEDARDQNELLEFRILELEVRDSLSCKLSNGAELVFEPKLKFI